ncbi:MAG: PDZ domain-containing protein [Bacteroidales bacterium]|nr:PDZ domain-containing protein [Bacteroidales bacterium]
MNRYSFITLAALSVSTMTMSAADSPLWLRYPAISPDGSKIAFCFQGDIYTVDSRGGRATQLTTNPAHDYMPIWSPKGDKIAFASDREGSMDIYIMDARGGQPQRLTWSSGAETPMSFLDDTHIIYSSSVLGDVNDLQFPGNYAQTYVVETTGDARPQMLTSLHMENVSVNPVDGRLLYTDKKGYEDPWRKHHQSSVTRDIWLTAPDAKSGYEKLTSFRGEDRNPVWAPDGQSYYYLSEADGSMNVYQADPSPSAKAKQLTHHTTHPVRFLSGANNGTLAYSYDGALYTLAPGNQPQRLNVEIVGDRLEKSVIPQTLTSGANTIAVAPNGKEVAFIAHGDVYVTSIEYGTTKRITDTPQQERNVAFSPGGRSLVYSAERPDENGLHTWGIYESSLVRPEDKYFTYAQEIEEHPLVTGVTAFQPQYSPDGKEVAFLKNRTELCVVNLESRQQRTVLPGQFNYSYTDGDITYCWSPDSRWFLVDYIGIGGWNNSDIALVKADGSGDITNLTESGYSDGNPHWVLDGKAMIWQSDRAGYRSHGSWGAEEDVYIMFFDEEAFDHFRLSKEELALADELKDNADKDKDDADDDSDKSKGKSQKAKGKGDKSKGKSKEAKAEDDESVEPLTFDLTHHRDRIRRLTTSSANMGDAILSPKGDKLYYIASNFDGEGDLWELDLKEGNQKILIKNAGYGAFQLNKEGKKGYMASRGGLKEIDFDGGSSKDISFKADFNLRPAQERQYIFDHAWQQVKEKFYDPDIHGIDWEGYREAYQRYMPWITNNYDFAEMLSEMLGELNASHTGARYYPNNTAQTTALLGAYFDNEYQGDGLRISEIIVGGPMDRADVALKAGDVITSIDGQPIEAGKDYYRLLAGKAGKTVTLGVTTTEGKKTEQRLKPVGGYGDLLYKRWVERNRRHVEEATGGKVGYVHVKSMDSESFRTVFSELLGRYRNCDAVIVDVRHNGGGWLHEDLAILLSGKEFAQFKPRGQYVGSDPFNRWNKPSCVLVCEDDYSNAHGFPWTYKTLGLGQLIGTPVPGTMTAVWWERQIDPSLVFGIPQVGCVDEQGRYLENQELWPDIEVYTSPEQILNGQDPQLDRAIKEMLSH